MGKNILLRILFILAVLAVCAALIYVIFLEVYPDLIPIIKSGSTEDIETYLRESSSFKGAVCAALLQMVQVWSIFIAGTPLQIAIGAVYGLKKGFLICHVFTTLAQYIALLVWKRVGKQMEKWLPMDAGKNKGFNLFLNSGTPPAYTVFNAYLVPIMPSGLFPLLAYKLNLESPKFALAVWIGSIMSVFLGCACGERIMAGDWVTAAFCFGIQFVVAFFAWTFRHRILEFFRNLGKRFNRKKDTDIQ